MIHNATLYTIYRSFGDVRSTSDLLKMVPGARRVGNRGP
jgi:hypothetical protein